MALTCASNRETIDWETASANDLPLFDLIYHKSIQAYLFAEKRLVPGAAGRLIRLYLERLAIEPDKFRKLALCCLAQDWLRRREAGNTLHAAFLLHLIRSYLTDPK